MIRDLLDHGASEEPMNPLSQGNDSSVPVMNRDPNNLSWVNNPLSDFPKKTYPEITWRGSVYKARENLG